MPKDSVKLHLIYIMVSVTISNLANHNRITILIDKHRILQVYAVRLGNSVGSHNVFRVIFGNLDVFLRLASSKG
ncbi:MAG: hypothetical protein ACOCPC_03230 [Segatella copri]